MLIYRLHFNLKFRRYMLGAFDDDLSTSYISNTNSDCALEWALPPGVAADVYAVRLHPVPPSVNSNGPYYLRGAYVEAGADTRPR
jgi:hypothetical protein